MNPPQLLEATCIKRVWRGLTLDLADAAMPYAPSEAQKKGIQKHQAVFSLDFETWEQLVEEFGITKSIIPHREETYEDTSRWYG